MGMYSAKELSAMESWRGLSAYYVFLYHVIEIFIFPITGDKGVGVDILTTLSTLALLVFFLLSGMLISYSA